jgi:hypothetical protein
MPKMESDFSYEFKDFVTARLPGVVAFKHCDRFTKGIPDLSFSSSARTVWVESKRIGLKDRKKREQILFNPRTWVDNEVQLDLITRLNGWYMIFDGVRSQYLFVKACTVYQAYHGHKLIPETDDGAVCDDDLKVFYGNVLLTLSRGLKP